MTSVSSDHFQRQQAHPWLNESVLGALDTPSLSGVFVQAQPEPRVYDNPLAPGIHPNAFRPSTTDQAFDQMLHSLETEIVETERPEERPLPDLLGDTPLGSDVDSILSPEARALLHCFPDRDCSNPTGNWWTGAPPPLLSSSSSMAGDLVVPRLPFSPSFVPLAPAPSPSYPNAGPFRLPGLDCLPQFPDTVFSLDNNDRLPNMSSVDLGCRPLAPRSKPATRQTQGALKDAGSRSRPYRKFRFVLEDIGGQAPVFLQ
ncbi:hypothetical protein N7454_000120 [Penicillium verhagenii]|nr:hypothetical protein N7454_000120 [Penicillium verhagenii]